MDITKLKTMAKGNESKYGNLALFRSVRFLTRPAEKGGKAPFVTNKVRHDGSALAVLAHLGGRCDIKKAYKLTIRQKTLADDTCFSERTIRSCLAQLEELRFIRRTERMGRADTIWVNAKAIFDHRAAVEACRNEEEDEDLAFPSPQEERPEDNTDGLDLPTGAANRKEKKVQQEVIHPTANGALAPIKETQTPGDTLPSLAAHIQRLSAGLTERVLHPNIMTLATCVKDVYEDQGINDDDAVDIARKALAKVDGHFLLALCALMLLDSSKLNAARCDSVVAVVLSQLDGVMDAARQRLEQERMDSEIASDGEGDEEDTYDGGRRNLIDALNSCPKLLAAMPRVAYQVAERVFDAKRDHYSEYAALASLAYSEEHWISTSGEENSSAFILEQNWLSRYSAIVKLPDTEPKVTMAQITSHVERLKTLVEDGKKAFISFSLSLPLATAEAIISSYMRRASNLGLQPTGVLYPYRNDKGETLLAMDVMNAWEHIDEPGVSPYDEVTA